MKGWTGQMWLAGGHGPSRWVDKTRVEAFLGAEQWIDEAKS
jgi:hypothetical protein